MATLPYQGLLQLVRQLPQSIEELKALAESVVAPDRQQRIADLLELNRDQQLSAKSEAELDELLAEVDRIALLKARTAYTLQLKQDNVDQLL